MKFFLFSNFEKFSEWKKFHFLGWEREERAIQNGGLETGQEMGTKIGTDCPHLFPSLEIDLLIMLLAVRAAGTG